MNKCILMGRLVRQPEIKESGETKYLQFTLAVNRKYTKKDDEVTADFLSCTAFGKTAEFISNYFDKGQQIIVEGRVQNNTYKDEEGKQKSKTGIVVEAVEFCGNKTDSHNNEEKQQANTEIPTAQQDFDNFAFTGEGNDLPF